MTGIFRTLLLAAGFMLSGCGHGLSAAPLPACLDLVAADSSQAVTVSRVEGAAPHQVTVQLFSKVRAGWEAASAQINGVAGRNGLAPPGEKREGDGRTPSGVFPIAQGFGYAPLEIKLPYLVLTPDMIWIDDPASPDYNRLASLDRVHPASYEVMRRSDDLYRYGAVIAYNTDPVVSGRGSAIFFHIRRAPDSATSGCVAVSEEEMVRILRWLDPAKRPVAVLGVEELCGDRH